MKSLAVIIACFLGGSGVAALPVGDVARASDALIAVFAILAGLLVQMIALTAVIFEPGRLSADSVRQIGKGIEDLQRLNIWLFGIYGIALLAFLAIKLIEPHTYYSALTVIGTDARLSKIGWDGASVGGLLCFSAGAAATLATVRTFRTLATIRELQRLRTEVLARDADARDKLSREHSAERLRPVADQGGAKYGDFVPPPAPGKKKSSKG